MAALTAVQSGGFRDPVLDAQTVFRAVMDALARPGTIRALAGRLMPPSPLTPELAALVLTLADHDTPVWLDSALAASGEVRAWLAFETGAPVVDTPVTADFALILDLATATPLSAFAFGTDEYPDRSTTLIAAVPALSGGEPLTIRGPGIDGSAAIAPQGLPPDFAAQWAANRAAFPRGVDLLLAAEDAVMGLPRTSRIVEG